MPSRVLRLEELGRRMDGELLCDDGSRRLYATDASPLQRLPLAIARPRHAEDCRVLVEYAREHGHALVSRGAGTGLGGQCLGTDLVVDTAHHMSRILRVDPGARLAEVEPGVVPARLNAQLAPHGLMFAPDPSTADRCTLGGMMGTNAWGAHAPRDGSTRDHVRAMEVVLSDAGIARLAPIQDSGEASSPPMVQRLERGLGDIVDRHLDLIRRSYPSWRGIPNNSGYALDVLARNQPWEAGGPPFNLAPFLCGSEGTLVLITRATLNLVPMPGQRLVLGAQFASLDEALQAVPAARALGAAAVELLDRPLLDLARRHPQHLGDCGWLGAGAAALLLVEFSGEPADVLADRARAFERDCRGAGLGLDFPVLSGAGADRAWALRKGGLGLLMGMPGPRRPVTGMEDTAVAVADLPAYVKAVQRLLDSHGLQAVIYGSVSMGLVHLRPLLDLRAEADQRLYAVLMEDVAHLVAGFGGSLSAKHGDGLLRGPYLPLTLGRPVVGLLEEVKRLFDPAGCFNPGKIVGSPRRLEGLRTDTGPVTLPLPRFDWSASLGLPGAAERCQGAGVCLRGPEHGSMCPTYMATGEELHGTRGRANLIRQSLSGDPGFGPGDEAALAEALDSCLGCKACHRECPAGVDLARLKAEMLQQRWTAQGTPLRLRALGRYETLLAVGARAPGLANRLLEIGAIRRFLGLEDSRRLPALASRRLSHWFAGRVPRGGGRGPGRGVVVVADPLTEFLEPQVGQAAVELMERLGSTVRLEYLPLGRLQISQGLLDAARRRLERALDRLAPLARAGWSLVGLEPSEILTLRDEGPALVAWSRRGDAAVVAHRSLSFDEWLLAEGGRSLEQQLPGRCSEQVLLHVHCHQRALVGAEASARALALVPGARVELIHSGCCGLAGLWGYQAAHGELSRRVAGLRLLPALRRAAPGTVVVATGSSCRRQIEDLAGVRALHPAQWLHRLLRA